MVYSRLFYFFIFIIVLFTSGCESPSFGKKVEKTYFTGGQISSAYIWSDSSGKNGILKKYGYAGHLTSTVHIVNGVKDGIETLYDKHGRIIQQIPYINGRIHGIVTAFYPNGDKMITYTYKYGIKDGNAFTYNPDGTICKRAKYKRDKLVH